MLLHSLSTLLTGIVFAFYLEFSFFGMPQGPGRDPTALLFYTTNRLSAHIPTHCDSLKYHVVPCDFKYDQSAHRQSIKCLPLQGEQEEPVNLWEFSPRDVRNEHAGFSSDGAWIVAGCPPGSWPQFLSGSVEMMHLTVL